VKEEGKNGIHMAARLDAPVRTRTDVSQIDFSKEDEGTR